MKPGKAEDFFNFEKYSERKIRKKKGIDKIKSKMFINRKFSKQEETRNFEVDKPSQCKYRKKKKRSVKNKEFIINKIYNQQNLLSTNRLTYSLF